MSSYIGSMMRAVWNRMRSKEYRDSYVAAHLSNTVSSQIRALRDECGWTQGKLAAKAGMKQSRISALEDPNYDNYEIQTLRRLASAFDVGLTVRFVPYSELAKWAGDLSDARINVARFDEDFLDSQVAATTETGSVLLHPIILDKPPVYSATLGVMKDIIRDDPGTSPSLSKYRQSNIVSAIAQ